MHHVVFDGFLIILDRVDCELSVYELFEFLIYSRGKVGVLFSFCRTST